jgi:hypothetical protein
MSISKDEQEVSLRNFVSKLLKGFNETMGQLEVYAWDANNPLRARLRGYYWMESNRKRFVKCSGCGAEATAGANGWTYRVIFGPSPWPSRPFPQYLGPTYVDVCSICRDAWWRLVDRKVPGHHYEKMSILDELVEESNHYAVTPSMTHDMIQTRFSDSFGGVLLPEIICLIFSYVQPLFHYSILLKTS